MKPSELTPEVVRNELTCLMERYPDNMGTIIIMRQYQDTGEEYDDSTCVYYTDETGVAITPSVYGEIPADVVLARPVCIVGQWIETFHPEFKNDDVIRDVLTRNATIRSLEYENTSTFDPDVQRLLVIAQETQDRGDSWSAIDLDVHPDDRYK
jgi:hypothetical protein